MSCLDRVCHSILRSHTQPSAELLPSQLINVTGVTQIASVFILQGLLLPNMTNE